MSDMTRPKHERRDTYIDRIQSLITCVGDDDVDGAVHEVAAFRDEIEGERER
jgi:hypothetical protein